MKKLSPNQIRCEDCINLVEVKGVWCCAECFNQSIEEIDDCPEGIQIAEVEENRNQKIKVNIGAKSDEKKERKPRERKIDNEKEYLLGLLAECLEDKSICVEKENEVKLHFNYCGNQYSVTLTKHRK